MQIIFWFFVMFLMVLPGDLVAQKIPLITPGARLRILAPSIAPYRLVGSVVSVDSNQIMLNVEGTHPPGGIDSGSQSIKVAFASVRSLEVSLGRKRSTKRILIGTGIGLFAGMISGAAIGELQETHRWDLFGGGIGTTMGYGLIGAAVGIIIGTIPKEQWQAVPLIDLLYIQRYGPTL